MTVSDKLLISLLRSKDEATLSRINKKWLDSEELKKLFYVFDYVKDYSCLPGVKTFCSDFGFDEKAADSRPTYYLKQVKERYITAELSEFIPPLLKRLKANPKEVLKEIKAFTSTLDEDEESSKDSRYSDEATSRVETYRSKAAKGGVVDYSTGDAVLDAFFYGYRKADLVTFGGRAGSRKTFLLCYLALLAEAALPEDAGDILFITNEIDSEEIKERMDCISFKLPYEAFTSGKLSRRDFKKYKESLEALEKNPRKITIIEDCYTLDTILTKLLIYRPSILFIDGSYLLEPNSQLQDWQKITYITRGLKRMSKTYRVPTINTTQMKRGTGKGRKDSNFQAQDEFAFSNSYNQDSDISFLMYQDNVMKFHSEVGMQIGKGRRVNGEKTPVFICPLETMELGFRMLEDEEDFSTTTTLI